MFNLVGIGYTVVIESCLAASKLVVWLQILLMFSKIIHTNGILYGKLLSTC
jgi:hypothetical protein